MPGYKAVLFDLDGTINDSGPGIMNSVRHALRKMGYECPPDTELRKYVGPSLMYSFTNYAGMNEIEAEMAVELYRECYLAGECYNLTIYSGIREVFGRLHTAGISCAVVTSKPQNMAKKILEHFDLAKCFDAIVGPDPDDPSSRKVFLIRRAMEELGLGPDEVVMVGDTRFDIQGAKEAGCDSIGVTYGYGTRQELEENGADHIVDTCAQIAEAVGI